MTPKIKSAVLISGRGTNMIALAKAAQRKDYPAEIALVISNIPTAAGLEKADTLGIMALAIDHKAFASRRAFEKALHSVLTEAGIELICCAGFMRVLSPWFVKHWEGRILNIHPSLLPKYKGLNTHQRALDAGDHEHGCTVHYVEAELDNGPVILQESVPVQKDDTAETLAERLLPIENALYPRALAIVAREAWGRDA